MDDKTMEKYIEKYFSNFNFDIRKKKKKKEIPRFTDQKCTPDIIQSMAAIILDWVENGKKEWNIAYKLDPKNSLWHYPMFSEIFQNVYGKPNPLYKSKSEYNKILSHPNIQFVYAELLERDESKRMYIYKIKNAMGKKILEFIAESGDNAFIFQNMLYDKVSSESGFTKNLIKYKKNDHADIKNIKKPYKKLKDSFYKLLSKYTDIKKDLEKGRIFAKFLNNYALKNEIRGSYDGRPTKFIPKNLAQIETRKLLFYNKENWFDEWLKKPKDVTRKTGVKINKQEKISIKKWNTRVKQATDEIKTMYSKSEHEDKISESGYEAHHIFLKSEYKQYAFSVENIIKITDEQHAKAHFIEGKKNFSEAETKFQKQLLISKSKSIEESINKKERKYDKEKFIEILNEGLGLRLPENSSFDEIRKKLS
jgi:hypothetical protein